MDSTLLSQTHTLKLVMINKSQTEQILRLNGLTSEATPEEVRTVLVRARWHKDDVEAAIEALHRKPDKVSVEHNPKTSIMNSDHRIAPETLNAVLGIDVELTQIRHKDIADQNWFLKKQILSLVLITLLGSVLFLITVMWQLKIGLFEIQF